LLVLLGLAYYLFTYSTDVDLVAEGVVVEGEASSDDNAHSCGEVVEFTTAGGERRRVNRACGGLPEIGAHVTVHYSRDLHGQAYVEGDARPWSYSVALLVILFGARDLFGEAFGYVRRNVAVWGRGKGDKGSRN
jgi:hypothetical protein